MHADGTPVCLVIGELRPYGGQRVVLDLATALKASRQVVLATWHGARSENAAHVPQGVEHWHCAPTSRAMPGPVSAWAVPELRRRLARMSGANVVSFMTHANLVATAATRGLDCRLVVSEHNLTSTAVRGDPHPRATQLGMRIVFRWAPRIVGVSDAVVEDLATTYGVPRERLRRVYNPIDCLRIERLSAKPRAPHQWLDHPETTSLLIVGALKPAKGHRHALEALRMLPDRFKLIVVGDGPLLGDLQRMAHDLQVERRVHFAGFQLNPYPYMAAADLLLVPSLYEGFGLVAAEAAALGTPVVGAQVAGLEEVLSHIGASGFPSGNSSALAARILETPLQRRPIPDWLATLTPERVAADYLSMLANL